VKAAPLDAQPNTPGQRAPVADWRALQLPGGQRPGPRRGPPLRQRPKPASHRYMLQRPPEGPPAKTHVRKEHKITLGNNIFRDSLTSLQKCSYSLIEN